METGLLCYIKDYSGNYYRADKSDQLVAATCESEATVFTFTQANDRIGTGKKAAFYCVVPIVERDREEQKNKTEQTEGGEIETEDEATHRLAVKDLILDELQNPPEKNVLSYDLSELDWTEYLTHFTYIVSGMKDYRDELAQQHSDIEQKICDILHYIELCETDESEAADFIELLRVCREKRRAVKDELMRLEYFQSNFGTSANVAGAKQALKSIKGLESRRYKPRKYNELFENCVIKDRQKKGAENYAPGAKQDREK